MATEYTITYTFTGQDNTSGNRSVAFNRFSASGDTGRNIGQITSIQYVHYHTSAGSMRWGLMGRLVLSDGTTFVSDQIYHNIDGDVVGYTNTFSVLLTAEQFAMLASVQTLDTQWKTTSGGYSSKLYWRATSKYPMRIIVKFIEEPPITYAPKVDKFEAVRCNEIGVIDDEGQYITTSLKLSVGDASGLPIAQCRIYYAANDYPNVNSSPYVDVTSRISDLISGVTFDTSILTGVWNLGSIWNFAVIFVMGEESAISTASVARGSTSFHISDEPGGGAAVGGYSTGTSANPKFESHVPAHFYAGINGVTNYSTQEVNTGGKWIDGKNIYSRTFTKENFALPKGENWIDIAPVENYANIRVIDIRGALEFSGAGIFPLDRYINTTEVHTTYIAKDGNLRLYSYYKNLALTVLYYHATIFYTRNDV